MIISDKPHKLCYTFTTVLYLLQGVCHRKARGFGTNGTIWISTANHADATDAKLNLSRVDANPQRKRSAK